jgi:hypothetical protein
VYVPSTLADLERVQVAIRLAGPAAPFGPKLRRAATAVDPEMRVDDVLPLDRVAADTRASDDMLLAESIAEGATRDLILSGVGVAAVLMVVGLIGCAVPLARALRVQLMRALSTE